MENILTFLSHDLYGPKVRIAVLGDAMVDEYYDVSVKKLSQESPIPVAKTSRDNPRSFPGGAANVAYQFINFNVHAPLFSLIDQSSRNVFLNHGLAVENSKEIEFNIPRKKRFFAENHPIFRWDVEGKDYHLKSDNLKESSQEIYNAIYASKDYIDCLILTDYDKGVFNNFQKWIFETAPITIVDPKDGDFRRWKGCTVFKPNRDEALRLTKKNNLIDAGNMLSNELECAVVITESGEGVTVFEKGKVDKIRPVKLVDKPESVIGAGDCFVAFLAMALSRKFTLLKAAEVAFEAGLIYVRNKHNKPLSHYEINKTIDPISAKCIHNPKSFFAKRDYKLVMTNGCFDILHAGHLHSFKAARNYGDKLLVAVNTDESVSALKPGRPVLPLEQRMAALQACQYVDFVVPFSEQTPEKLIREVMPDVVAKGGDYKLDQIIGFGIVPEVVRLPILEGLSSSKIIEKIKS